MVSHNAQLKITQNAYLDFLSRLMATKEAAKDGTKPIVFV